MENVFGIIVKWVGEYSYVTSVANPHQNCGYAEYKPKSFSALISLSFTLHDWIVTVFQLFINGGQVEFEQIAPNPTSHQKNEISGNKKGGGVPRENI